MNKTGQDTRQILASGETSLESQVDAIDSIGVPPYRSLDTTPEATAADIDLESADLYLNRELTWLAFNRRVLQMAADEHTPLLERVKFLAIVSSNLDEFFMKRIGGLKQQIAAGINTVSVDGKTPLLKVEAFQAEVRKIHHEVNRIYLQVLGLVAVHGIRMVKYADLQADE